MALDCSLDGSISPIDALLIFNSLNQQSRESQSVANPTATDWLFVEIGSAEDDTAALWLMDEFGFTSSRRRSS